MVQTQFSCLEQILLGSIMAMILEIINGIPPLERFGKGSSKKSVMQVVTQSEFGFIAKEIIIHSLTMKVMSLVLMQQTL